MLSIGIIILLHTLTDIFKPILYCLCEDYKCETIVIKISQT